MNSLRTDDIQGARPTFRHPPKSILRKRNFDNEYFQKRIQPAPEYQPIYNQSKYLSNINMSQSYMAKSPPKSYQHQNNYGRQYQKPQQLVPDIRSDRLYANPAFYPKQYLYRQPYDNPQSMRSYYSKEMINSNQNHQYYEHNKNYDMQQFSHQQQLKAESKPSSPIPKQNLQQQLIQQSKDRLQKNQRLASGRSSSLGKNVQKPSVFRGLGFNIITNNKFTYDFERTFDNKK